RCRGRCCSRNVRTSPRSFSSFSPNVSSKTNHPCTMHVPLTAIFSSVYDTFTPGYRQEDTPMPDLSRFRSTIEQLVERAGCEAGIAVRHVERDERLDLNG